MLKCFVFFIGGEFFPLFSMLSIQTIFYFLRGLRGSFFYVYFSFVILRQKICFL